MAVTHVTQVTAADATVAAHFKVVATGTTATSPPGLGHQVGIADGHTLTNPAGNTLHYGDPTTYGVCLETTDAAGATKTGGTGKFKNLGTFILHGGIKMGGAASFTTGNVIWGPNAIWRQDRGDAHATGATWQIQDAISQLNARVTLDQTGATINRANGNRPICDGTYTSTGTLTCPAPEFIDHSSFNSSGMFDLSFGTITAGVLPTDGGAIFRGVKGGVSGRIARVGFDLSSSKCYLPNCLFDACGTLTSTASTANGAAQFCFSGSLWKNSAEGFNISFNIGESATPGAAVVRDFIDVFHDGRILLGVLTATFKLLQTYTPYAAPISLGKAPRQWQDVLLGMSTNGDTLGGGPGATCTINFDSTPAGRTFWAGFTDAHIPGSENWHPFSHTANSANLTLTADQWYWDASGSVQIEGPGDMATGQNNNTLQNVTTQHNFLRPINVGSLFGSFGRISSMAGSGSGTTWKNNSTVKHGTLICGSSQPLGNNWNSETAPAVGTVGESGTTSAKVQITQAEDCICWTPTTMYGGTVYNNYSPGTNTFSDGLIPAASRGHVGYRLLTDGTWGFGYGEPGVNNATMFSVAPPTVTNKNPKFTGKGEQGYQFVGSVNMAHHDLRQKPTTLGLTVTSITKGAATTQSDANFATIVTATPHGLSVNHAFELTGAGATLNGQHSVYSVTNSTTFVTVVNPAAPASATGTISRVGSATHFISELRKKYDPDTTFTAAYDFTTFLTAFETAWTATEPTLNGIAVDTSVVNVVGALPLAASAALAVGSLSLGTPSTSDVTVTWGAPSGGTTPYSLVLEYGAGASPSTWTAFSSALTGTAVPISGLAAGTLYTVRKRVTDSASGADSVTASFTTVSAGSTVTGVSVAPSTATVIIGATTTLTATVAGTGSPSQSVTWSSGTPSVATVNSIGVVTAVAQGSATITATSVQDGTKAGTAAITVPAPAVTGISISPSTPTVAQGATTTLTATVTGTGSPSQSVTWGSTNPAVASVSGSGVVSGIAQGTATVTATSVQNGSFVASVVVTVGAPAPFVSAVMVSPGSASLIVGATAAFGATVLGSAGIGQGVTWASSAPSVASVNSSTGVVTALTAGATTITGTSTVDGSKKGTAAVSVSAASAGGGVFVPPPHLRERVSHLATAPRRPNR